MNKIKTLYDVVQTIKNQETFNGQMNTKILKDNQVVFAADKSFEKDQSTGKMKGHIKSEMGHDGCKVKHESEFEFDGKSCGGHGHHGRGFGKRHQMMREMHGHQEDICCEGHGHGGSIKRKLNRASMMLDLLNRLEIEAGADQTKTLQLKVSLNDLPEDIQAHLKSKACSSHCCGPHGKHLQDVKSVEALQVKLTGVIGADNKINSLKVVLEGVYKDNEEKEHQVNVNSDISMK